MLPLPHSVEVNSQYADFLQYSSSLRKMLKVVFSSRRLLQEIRKRPSILRYPSKILKLILFSGRAELTSQWVTDFIKTQHLDPGNYLLYSYWFDHTATGFAMTKQDFPGTKIVSRAHGYDIYEEYYYPYYWPYRHETLEGLAAVFFASDAGKNYYCDRYPEFKSKYETAHLGIKDPGFLSNASEDGVFRIVSCAHMVPVKRLDLLLEGVAAAAHLRPQQKFEWIHFGDGTGKKSLSRRMNRSFPLNVQGRLAGYVPNDEIMRHYKDCPVDVFVNVSSTEGGAPISIQEAISCGIPVVATSVGGNPEVVSEKNGILLSPNPKPQEIAAALLKIWDNPGLAAQMRTASHQLWQTSYNAEVNFRTFAERLKAIGES
ncbi:MAG TPA: glycosyltransferase [Anaerolineales bacterium]|nr:glycosyltransferase [Anaerolineales bacterium]